MCDCFRRLGSVILSVSKLIINNERSTPLQLPFRHFPDVYLALTSITRTVYNQLYPGTPRCYTVPLSNIWIYYNGVGLIEIA